MSLPPTRKRSPLRVKPVSCEQVSNAVACDITTQGVVRVTLHLSAHPRALESPSALNTLLPLLSSLLALLLAAESQPAGTVLISAA